MKPPPFRYHAPTTRSGALDTLAEAGAGGQVLAGGQSLIPLMNMRLAAPADLVDINGVAELNYVRVDEGGVRVGAVARHADVEHNASACRAVPLLDKALRLLAHPVIRNRGTAVGSLLHADPAGELTAVLALLDGTVELASAGRTRTVGAADFFVGPMQTCAAAGELATSAYFPCLPGNGAAAGRSATAGSTGRTGTAFRQVARRHGDYALCGVACAVALDDGLRVSRARAAFLGVAPVPQVLDVTGALAGAPPVDADWTAAGQAAAEAVDPEDDIHATAAYRSHLVRVLTAKALAEAADEARTPTAGRDT